MPKSTPDLSPKIDRSIGPSRRIKKRTDYLKVQDKGAKCRTKHFLLSYLDSSNSEDSRIGVTVTKKVDKRAVARNAIKRRVREIFRSRRPFFVKKADVVIIALQGASELSFDQISRQINYLFYKSNLLEQKRPKS
jgi:ribonuclease P protein component